MMNKKIKSEFIIGDEWVYFKIYTGQSSSDLIITSFIKAFIKKLKKEKIIDKWFFIRYSDPENHLRLRFHLTDNDKIGNLILDFNKRIKKFCSSKIVWNIQMESYKRETQRYGIKTMEISEDLFHYDSELIINFLTYFKNTNHKSLRWIFGMVSIDHFLNNFNYTLNEKINLFGNLKDAYSSEFNINRDTKNKINQKYKAHLNHIIQFFNTYTLLDEDHYEISRIINKRNKKINKKIEQIIIYNEKGELDVSLESFIRSHIHMQTNRLFNSEARLSELILYDFLYKFYNYLKAKK
ncbi:hypothetical protein FIA58_018580 [Flavobacterium jejuense]|uniref:Thiopeptide-type bacteriocin biosynthesis domain-containing protein n=1 Tax=Flavobacterium jejuense TaxID=1544455 RepID=A0ABX0IV51_9FLAO|nr:thiopeptide-type bacteriocin biosynthesis protein [Flavobacterium jejuense]NHN27692.1 hypothetical protein [Flavobacterium jejuense]